MTSGLPWATITGSMIYEAPSIRVLGTLSEMTQSLLPSLRAAGGTMGAISAPVVGPGGSGVQGESVQGQANSSSPAPVAAAPTPVSGTGDSSSPVASTPADTGGDTSASAPSTSSGDSGGTGGTTPVAASTGSGTGSGAGAGELPFTGFAAGAVAAAGAVLTGAGVALRRALRNER